jgi:hypothetical protein
MTRGRSLEFAPLWLTVLAVLALPVPASALPEFPADVEAQLNMTCLPQCTICHLTNPGNGANASQPFVQALLATQHGGFDSQALAAALTQVEKDGTDSDKDGVADITELKQATPTDPNVASSATTVCADDIKYGCGAARIAPGPSSFGWAELALSWGVSLFFLRRRLATRLFSHKRLSNSGDEHV